MTAGYPTFSRILREGGDFDFADLSKTMGAPSFAQFAKVGIQSARVRREQIFCRQHRHPPLQNAQGRGTLCCGSYWQTRPKAGPPAQEESA